jgi:uncharacterized protein (UPF0332 family)
VSKLKEKANFNFEASKRLIELNLYAPSVHCAYYSCFQLIKFIIKDFFEKDYDKQDQEILSQNSNSHTYAINYIIYELKKNKFDIKKERDFSRQIKDLKQFRVESDYHNTEITLDKSKKAFEYAQNTRLFLQRTFQV